MSMELAWEQLRNIKYEPRKLSKISQLLFDEIILSLVEAVEKNTKSKEEISEKLDQLELSVVNLKVRLGDKNSEIYNYVSRINKLSAFNSNLEAHLAEKNTQNTNLSDQISKNEKLHISKVNEIVKKHASEISRIYDRAENLEKKIEDDQSEIDHIKKESNFNKRQQGMEVTLEGLAS